MSQWLALLLTVAIEVPLVWGLAVLRGWARGARVSLLLAGIGVNLATHPLLWLAELALQDRLVAFRAGIGLAVLGVSGLLTLEAGVVLVEAIGYAVVVGLGFRRGLIASLLANATSLVIGIFLVPGLSIPWFA